MDAQALGRFLHQSREAKELTLEEAERVLHIRRRILESFELGDFNIPDASVVQIKGFIRNYAHFLGLDEERVVQYYDAARLNVSLAPAPTKGRGKKKKKRDTQPVVPVAAKTITDTDPSLPAVPLAALNEAGRKSSGSGPLTLIFRLLVAAAALAVIVFVGVQLLQQSQSVAPGVSDIFGQLPPSPTFTAGPTMTTGALLPPTPLPGSQGAAPAFTGSGVLVNMELTERTWLRIVTDGVVQYEDMVTPGTRIEIPAQERIQITASNAGGLNVTWNGQPQGAFGARGQQVDVVFTETGVEISSGPTLAPTSDVPPTPLPTSPVDIQAAMDQLTPSDTPGPSPTASETPTITPIPSETPVPSATSTETPVPSATPTLTLSPVPTETPTMTMMPSPTAILPPRQTPANPTPTKSGA